MCRVRGLARQRHEFGVAVTCSAESRNCQLPQRTSMSSLSTSTLAKVTSLCSSASFWKWGATILQGPHPAAESRSSGVGAHRTPRP